MIYRSATYTTFCTTNNKEEQILKDHRLKYHHFNLWSLLFAY